MTLRVALCLAALIGVRLGAQASAPPRAGAGGHWYRGNTHVHSTESDGNASPADVVRWYRDHGYQFVVLTDHERVTDAAPLEAQFGAAGSFLVIPGEEVTQQIADTRPVGGNRQAHLVAIGVNRAVTPLGVKGVVSGTSMADSYARNIAEIRAAGGVAQVNHPNFRWSVTPDDLRGVPDSTLFEVWNAQPHINNLGGDDGSGRVALSTDALWDTVLTRGTLLYGVASDDAHAFRQAQLEDPDATHPGGGWIMVRADSLTPPAILAALRSGDFYATTGIMLAEYAATARDVTLRVAFPKDARDDRRFRTRFIGRGGRLLAERAGSSARYVIRGDEGYVRAVITDSNGRRAWTQPLLVRAGEPPPGTQR